MRKKQISSAGLVYFHLCGKQSEDNQIHWEQTNSYCYFEKGFYSVVKEKLIKTRYEDDIVHLIGVIGEADKVEAIQQIAVKGIRDNAQRIIEGKKKDLSLDQYGNTFYRLIQEYFYEELEYFPFGSVVSSNQCTAYYVYAGDVNNEKIGEIANSI